ncbi:unnamed protein product [Protopolystoma xenopodis]|uniref:Uncharacterized protein n=1 Tax=Protopolystoma xenopodis TaxID=117903 RepID=A0A3S4ZX52_9PLAT|nr:unnamed protein product [Protopolystoma xenopodis]
MVFTFYPTKPRLMGHHPSLSNYRLFFVHLFHLTPLHGDLSCLSSIEQRGSGRPELSAPAFSPRIGIGRGPSVREEAAMRPLGLSTSERTHSHSRPPGRGLRVAGVLCVCAWRGGDGGGQGRERQ